MKRPYLGMLIKLTAAIALVGVGLYGQCRPTSCGTPVFQNACYSGTACYVSEQWCGCYWVAIDTEWYAGGC